VRAENYAGWFRRIGTKIMENGAAKDNLVVCQSNQGVTIRASLLRLTRYIAVIEIYSPSLVLQVSEVLGDFKIIINERTIYAGRAVVTTLVNAGTTLVCEARIEESGFLLASFSPGVDPAPLPEGFQDFLRHWQKLYRVLPEFKVVVADMQTFLADLHLWLEQVELEIRAAPSSNQLEMEQSAVREIGRDMVPAFDAMHERFESVSAGIEAELRPVHQNFAKRHLHPLVMCSPFAYRTYHKPLGYAGDYEMVDMILRDPYEGGSLFAKVVNLWFLSQWPARAHRNRIQHLKGLLKEEARRGAGLGRPMRVLNLGCGPAREVQEFLAEDALSDQAQFRLLDFNEETIRHTSQVLEDLKRRYGRQTAIQVQKKSVQHVLKEGAKAVTDAPGQKYDLIYCAGLLDYLPDRTCVQLMNVLYDWLAPGGLLATTNVEACKPFRHMLEFVLDWHLIYRGLRNSAALLPQHATAGNARLFKDPTEVNVFVEVRKPEHG
jgi:extracellular factor (EF) 3-hydroxypalmitic acid methyl ester biosynthesis protein